MALDAESIPYAASWGDNGALASVTTFAETIDDLAWRIEDVTLGVESP